MQDLFDETAQLEQICIENLREWVGAAAEGMRDRHKVVVFAKSRQGVRSILEAVEGDAALGDYFRPLRLVGKGSGGRFMSVREQVREGAGCSPSQISRHDCINL